MTRRVLLLGAWFLIRGEPARVVPITYSESVLASGSLGGVAFTDARLTLSLVSDTLNVIQFRYNAGIATVDVAGIGTATFTNLDMRVVSNPPRDDQFVG